MDSGLDSIGSINASVRLNNDLAYFFNDQSILKANIQAENVAFNLVEHLHDEFPGLLFKKIEAVCKVNNTQILFFSRDSVALYDFSSSTIVQNYPQAITDKWVDSNFETVSAAMRIDKDRICLFHQNGYSIINNDLKINGNDGFYNSMWSLQVFEEQGLRDPIQAALAVDSETALIFTYNHYSNFNLLGPGLVFENRSIQSDWSGIADQLNDITIDTNYKTFSFDHLGSLVRIHGYVESFTDQLNEFSYDDLTRPDVRSTFLHAQEMINNQIPLADNNWTRLKLYNKSDRVIDIALFYNNSLNVDSLLVYAKKNDGTSSNYRFGRKVARSNMILGDVPSEAAYGWGTSIYLPIESKSTLEFYIKCYGYKLGRIGAWPLYMYGVSTKEARATHHATLDYQIIYPHIFLLGLILMIGIYAFLVFLMNRDYTSLFLGIFILAVSYVAAFENDNYTRQFFIAHVYPSSAHYLPWLSSTMVGIASVSFALFNLVFLKASSISKYTQWILKTLIYVGLGFTVIASFGTLLLPESITSSWPLFLLISLFIYFFIIPFLVKKKNAVSYIILAGIVWLIIILFPAQIDNNFGPFGNPNSAFNLMINSPYVAHTALIGLITIYSLGVGYRSKMVNEEKVKFEELNKMKSVFFTNISHEFRTPLTLILGPLEKIKNGLSNVEDLNLIKLVQDNANSLLQLINQVLDLSKLETNNVTLNASSSDIISFLKGLFYSFNSLAEQKDISLIFSCEEESISMFFDQKRMEGIFANLISNAFKYSKNGTQIKLEILKDKKSILVSLKDSGEGIAAQDVAHIFERFYQVEKKESTINQGTGIGLALVREWVTLHKGNIRVESEIGVGSTFYLTFPLGKNHLSIDEIVSTSYTPKYAKVDIEKGEEEAIVDVQKILKGTKFAESDSSTREKGSTILIIEDHNDVRSFIKLQLAPIYQIIEAEDGVMGVQKAFDTIPNLIVCDVMMPGKNGYEVCQILKTDIRTSHIPVILLTAKAAQEEKLEGLQTGADDYIVKPFDSRELLTRIENLINLRKNLRTRFSTSVQIKPSEVSSNLVDQDFMTKALALVEENMSNEDFNVEGMTKGLGMSATQLNRKLRSLIDQSTNQYIKSIRLQRAADLLKKDSFTVSEIAFQTGFRSAAYFVATFKQQFDMPPGSYREQHRID